MKRKALLVFWAITLAYGAIAQGWSPVGNNIKTEWVKDVDPSCPRPEYPRPQMFRGDWMNLNGLWNYGITSADAGSFKSEGQILVPFAVESSLSGVGRLVGKDNALWYERTFTMPKGWKGKDVLLQFGAVDWKTEVWVNGLYVGSHTGGFDPFHFNVTPYLSKSSEQTLTIKVWDGTDSSWLPRGKQVEKAAYIWYTPVTGIWQTVWLEAVPQTHIDSYYVVSDISNGELEVQVKATAMKIGDEFRVEVLEGGVGYNPAKAGGKVVAVAQGAGKVKVSVPEARLWSVDDPYLYGMKVSVVREGKVVDSVDGYTALRKISKVKTDDGYHRMALNDKPLFQFGPLDQGWWPDGLYTAPTEEAMVWDIVKTKELGFNMIRKHIKVEPARWYMHCDKMGIIVWQDMPSGDKNPEWQMRQYFNGRERQRSAVSEANYRKEWKEIMDYLYSYPCIGVWVPFNEAWGQFKTAEIAEWTKQMDPSRLVNPASGGNHYQCGDMLDLHNYPAPNLYLYDATRPTVLGEYGGIGLVEKEHLWVPDRNWGYVQFNSSKEATAEYVKYANILLDLIPKGFSGAVYTQTTDVEIEVNGLITYDRKVIKLDEARVREINQKICNSLKK